MRRARKWREYFLLSVSPLSPLVICPSITTSVRTRNRGGAGGEKNRRTHFTPRNSFPFLLLFFCVWKSLPPNSMQLLLIFDNALRFWICSDHTHHLLTEKSNPGCHLALTKRETEEGGQGVGDACLAHPSLFLPCLLAVFFIVASAKGPARQGRVVCISPYLAKRAKNLSLLNNARFCFALT